MQLSGRRPIGVTHAVRCALLGVLFLLLTFSVIFFNFVADLLYFKLDPRVST